MLPYPPDPDAPHRAVCAATYYADLIPTFAFVFRIARHRYPVHGLRLRPQHRLP